MSVDNGATPRDATPTIVLVHGSCHGGWCWQRLSPLLENAGYRVVAPTLAGLAERQAELSTHIDLDTHVSDIVAAVQAQPGPVVLLGHSYAGFVISGVADRLAASGRIRSLIYLDAFVPQDGEMQADYRTPEVRTQLHASFAAGNPVFAKMPASYFGISDPTDIAWVEGQLSDHPLGTYLQRLPLKNPLPPGIRRSYIACTTPALASVQGTRQRVRKDAQWRYAELATGHDAMVTDPVGLCQLILELA
jgi:pimeloyl-ACP methyl ester carboxylesterase